MTEHPLSGSDAYLLAFLPAVSAVDLANYGIIDAVAASPGDEKLAHAVKFSRAAIKISESWSGEAYQRLAELATRCGLSVPARPTKAENLKAWIDQVRAVSQSAFAATGNQVQLAAFAAGSAAGDLYLALWIGRNTIYLRIAAPEHGFLRQCSADVGHSLGETSRRLTEALQPLRTAPVVAALADQLAALFPKTPDVVAVTSTDSLKAYFEWATQVSAHLDELGPALLA